MKNKKLNLKQITVTSFVTQLDAPTIDTAKGGASATVCGKVACITVVTFGLWTYCCGSDTEGNVC